MRSWWRAGKLHREDGPPSKDPTVTRLGTATVSGIARKNLSSIGPRPRKSPTATKHGRVTNLRRRRPAFVLDRASKRGPIVRHRLEQFKELRREILRAEEFNPQIAGLQRYSPGRSRTRRVSTSAAAGMRTRRAARWRRVRSNSSTARERRLISHWNRPPAAVSSRRAINASPSTEAFPARMPGKSRHELPGASLAHAKEFLDRQAVEVAGFHPAQRFQDFVKPMKPRGLVGHMGKASFSLCEGAIRHNTCFSGNWQLPCQALLL